MLIIVKLAVVGFCELCGLWRLLAFVNCAVCGGCWFCVAVKNKAYF
ncbi:hypothetical protein ACFQ02_05245 [Seminibacterium arietis]|uniref:Uncharacterized protein n=1 Tax=Seminibacterium arietis TaxID=1173502 RepID=A0ABW3I8I7_9PAST